MFTFASERGQIQPTRTLFGRIIKIKELITRKKKSGDANRLGQKRSLLFRGKFKSS